MLVVQMVELFFFYICYSLGLFIMTIIQFVQVAERPPSDWDLLSRSY